MGRVAMGSVGDRGKKKWSTGGECRKRQVSVRKKSRRKLGLHSERERGKTKEDRNKWGQKEGNEKKREKSDHLFPETEKGSEHDRANKWSSKTVRKYSLAKRRGTSLISLNSFTKNNVGEINQIWPFRCYFIKDKSENAQLLGYFSSTLEFSDSTYTKLPLQTLKTTVSRTCHRY